VTQTPSLVGLFIAPINRAGIEYMVTGGFAAVVYGHPRLTLDVDLVVRFAPIEYVIVNKLRYFQMGGSDRHLRDVARMMEISGADIDPPTLDRWIASRGLGAEWAKARTHDGRE
jgi:hypothetical protein